MTRAMAAENDVYLDGNRILQDLNRFRKAVMDLEASDTAQKQEVLERVEEARERLREALSVLSGMV